MAARINNAIRMRRDLMIRVARLFRDGDLIREIDRVPLDVAPRGKNPTRCCVYHDRAVIKYRLMALLGFGVDDEADELTTLASYAAEAVARRRVPLPQPTVLDVACDGCAAGAHVVTDACRGCVARPCTTSCPKHAVSIVNGRAVIDAGACINCGLCAGECAFHAIVYRPVPCEHACPVDAVSKDEKGRITIDESRCISCGRCLSACPFSAVMDRSHLIDVLTAIDSGHHVVAAIAPAGVGQFSAPFEQLVAACRALGFAGVHEVAHGADEVARREREEFRERVGAGERLMTSSCCPAYVRTVRTRVPDLIPSVSTTPSPMLVSAEDIRETDGDTYVVFVGPCLAKKREAYESGLVDAVLSFEELGALFVAAGIDVQTCAPTPADTPGGAVGRSFPVSGGVGAAVEMELAGSMQVETSVIDGISASSLRELKRLARDAASTHGTNAAASFVEVMACEGGCVAGPLVYGSPRSAARQVATAVAATRAATTAAVESTVVQPGER